VLQDLERHTRPQAQQGEGVIPHPQLGGVAPDGRQQPGYLFAGEQLHPLETPLGRPGNPLGGVEVRPAGRVDPAPAHQR
jgi:hypothetical protein